MKLRDGVSTNEQYNGFALDVDSVITDQHSLRTDRIELPYTGRLPGQFEDCTNARVGLVIKPHDVRVCLRADRDKGSLLAIIDAEPQEIVNLLDRFFETVNSGTTGLTFLLGGCMVRALRRLESGGKAHRLIFCRKVAWLLPGI